MQVQEGQVILVENERITEILPAEEAGKRNLKASGKIYPARTDQYACTSGG